MSTMLAVVFLSGSEVPVFRPKISEPAGTARRGLEIYFALSVRWKSIVLSGNLFLAHL